MEKNRELLSHLLVLKESIEGKVITPQGFNLRRINKAISIVEDTIRYKQAFFTEE
tara:strand:- start:1161 stop:1325 length:165 start_codon:yes stop_codon:yes gene_type:complete